MNTVKGEFISMVSVEVNGETMELSVWRNPESGKVTALETMDLPASNRFFYDAYSGQKVLVADTFSGLPK